MKNLLKNKTLLVLSVALAISLLIYGNGIKGGFVFDDAVVVEKRGDLKDISNFFGLFTSPYHQNAPQSGLYRPLTMASYSLNYAIFGLSPKSFHVINIIIHALNSYLVFWLVNFLFRRKKLAYFSFFLFLTHPIHTEAVTSIVGRAELLAFFWGMVTIYFFSRKQKFLSALSFLLALWSKESALMILPIIFFINWTQLGKRPVVALRNLAVYLVPLAFYAVFRFAALGSHTFRETVTTLVENPLKFLPFSERLAAALKVLFLYVQKLVWPMHLSADYSYNVIKTVKSVFGSSEALFGLVFLALVVFLAFYRRTRVSALGFGSAVFLFSYFLVSNLALPIGTIMAERLMYLPSLGFIIIVAFLLERLFGTAKLRRWAVIALVIVVIGFFSARTIIRNRDWLSDKSLFTAAFKESADGLVAHTALAAVHIKDNEWAEAENELLLARGIYKDNSQELNLLGIIADHRGDYGSAEEYFLRSVQLNDSAINSYINLGNLYLKIGRYEEAGRALLKVIEFNPTEEYIVRYAYIQIALQKPDLAIDFISRHYPDSIEGRESNAVMGTARFVIKDYAGALPYLEKARKLGKTNPEIDSMITISKQQLNIPNK